MPKRRSFWDYNEVGVYFYSRQAYDLAITELERAVKAAIIPMAVLHINLGAAYFGKKMYREARTSLEQGLRIEPDNQKGHWFLAGVLQAQGLRDEARAEFDRACALDPDSPEGRAAEAQARALHAPPLDAVAAEARRIP